MKFSIVAAVDERNGLSKDGKIPWYIKQDIEMFKRLTSTASQGCTNAVIMGSVTQKTFKKGFLPRRKNIVISSRLVNDNTDIIIARSLDEALAIAERERVENVFHIGGARSYSDAIVHPECNSVYLTRVVGDFSCDTFFPDIPGHYKKVEESDLLSEGEYRFRFIHYNNSMVPRGFEPPTP